MISSGGTGGGGGGAGGVSITLNVSDNRVQIENIIISSGVSKTIDIGEWNGKVYKIVIYASQPISKGYIKIQKIDPWSIWEVPSLSGDVYHYLKIDSNLGGKTSKVELYFSVDKSWVENNSIKDVYLWRYKNKWQRLSTEKVETTSDSINYKSTFSEFSHFAIRGEKETPPIPEETSTTILESICGDGVCDVSEDEISCPEDCRPSKTDIWYIVIPTIFLILVALLGIKEKLKKKPRKPVAVHKKQSLPPPIKIKEILMHPTNYIGKTVNIEGDIRFVEFSPEENKVLYNISDDTGTIEGLSRKTNYHGHHRIQGVVKRKGDNIYLYF